MKIAFYAPLKSPNHPVPSGDRLMARLLMAALSKAGHEVEIASELRSFTGEADRARLEAVKELADAEIERLHRQWSASGPPDLWFSYHVYYKTPDLIGPLMSSRFGIPYVTAEASYSRKRDAEGWAENQSRVTAAVQQAAVNICFTTRDRVGLEAVVPNGQYAHLPPFIDAAGFVAPSDRRRTGDLITVAMMRPGVKLDSYAMLAKALHLIRDRDWTLTVIGAGPARAEVQALFSGFDPARVIWRGEQAAGEVATALQAAGTYVWPGCGEAYGLAYLEAQACGLPVVAQATAGVPEVVVDGRTGILTPDGDVGAFTDGIAALLSDDAMHRSMSAAARDFARRERSLDAASRLLDTILRQYVRPYHDR